MKTTIYKTLLTAFAISIASVGFSQETPQEKTLDFSQETPQREKITVEGLASAYMEAMTFQVTLSSEQTERLMEINLDFAAKIKEAKERSAPEEEFILLYQNRDSLVRSVLTSEQFATWKEDPLVKMREQRERNRELNTKN